MLGALALASQAALIVQSDSLNFWNRIDSGTGANLVGTLPTQTTSGGVRTYDNDFGAAFLTSGQVSGTANKSTYIGPNIYLAMRQSDGSGTAPATISTARSQVNGMQITGAATTGGTTLDILLIVKKADFANGLSAASAIGFSSSDGFVMSVAQYNADSKSLRAVVKNGNTWYISQAANVNTTASAQKIVLTDAANALWAVWDPLTSIDAASLDFTSTVAGSTFTDIQAVGFYEHMVKAASGPIFAVTKMDIGATAIPEPATVGMLGLGCLVVLGIRRNTTSRSRI